MNIIVKTRRFINSRTLFQTKIVFTKSALLLMLFLSLSKANAQQYVGTVRTYHKDYPNVITFDAPTYVEMNEYPGIGIGFGYERFIDKQRNFSASLGMQKVWGGTNVAGKFRPGEVRANIHSMYFTPGFHYHPFGNTRGYDLSLGAILPIGNARWRYDVEDNTPHLPQATKTLAAALAEVSFSTAPRHFIFTVTFAAGPIITGGEGAGYMLQTGMKIGGRF
jgi:hypothetical protein